ncbi:MULTISPECIES: hypothetical protein [unclassified Rhizobium]|uniref:hypothetical protein n=1 Tax=unclassified Rhizobium TaxID=2613769 RepID=UPI0002717DB6|nr:MULTISPECIES: hypothetical protein [unclassified Rhizobium]EJL54371.1 hypothetical protein PMI09_02462 [Rhizobium sp. CF122]MBB3394458.1 hypothetical protein [Rhizobium sp. BK060]MBB4169502.1 hypothetical protein [Rhizobium sp. BK538]MBZ9792527.1 hypothetical protein [Rhizobium sp. 3T7]TCM75624.1 hypothetical protein EV291_113159 [Rhizobium sp. BK068]
MQHIDSTAAEPIAATKVWCIADFCSLHRLDRNEEAKLTALFGQFATTGELANNVTRRTRAR